MRRLVVPLTILTLILGLMAGSAMAQQTEESIGFLKVTQGAPGDIVEIPIYLRNDSTVTGIYFLFEFDHNILQPVIDFNPAYQELLDSLATGAIEPSDVPDSIDYPWDNTDSANSAGIWSVLFTPSDSLKAYNWQNPAVADPRFNSSYSNWASNTVFYNLHTRDSARLLMYQNPFVTITDQAHSLYFPPYIPAQMSSDGIAQTGDTVGVFLGTVRFRVNENATHGDQSILHTTSHIPSLDPSSPGLTTQLSEERIVDTLLRIIDNTVSPPDTSYVDTTISVSFAALPQDLLTSVFLVDTTGGGPPPEDENQLPVLSTIPQTVYNVSQGELVSFTVSATDAEAGVVTIRANGGSLTTPNASFGTGGVVTGGGGIATGVFGFQPAFGQEGNFVFSFQAQDDSGAVSNSQTVTVVVEGFEEDILFTSSSYDFKPAGGVPGFSDMIVPFSIVSEKVIYGIQFDVEYNADFFDLDSIFASDRIESWEIFDYSDSVPGYVRVVSFGLANDSMASGSTSAAIYFAMSVNEFADPGCYDLNILNGYESINPDPNVPGVELVTDSGVICVDRWGDVNLDRIVNVADLVSAVGYIINNYTLTDRQFAAGDLVPNDTVNVVDLVGIINAIFGLPIQPNPSGPSPTSDFAYLKVMHDEIPYAGIQSEVSIEAETPTEIAGVELDIAYNPAMVEMLEPELTTASSEFKIYSSDNGDGSMRVLIHSSHPWNDDELISEGLADIIRLPFISKGAIAADDSIQVRVTRAVMTTGAAKGVHVEGINPDPILPDHFELYQNRPNPFNPSTEIDFYIDGSSGAEHVKLEVFNILGQNVKTLIDMTLQPGPHTVTWDGTNEAGDKTASGVYLYRLKVGDADKTKKMVLLK